MISKSRLDEIKSGIQQQNTFIDTPRIVGNPTPFVEDYSAPKIETPQINTDPAIGKLSRDGFAMDEELGAKYGSYENYVNDVVTTQYKQRLEEQSQPVKFKYQDLNTPDTQARIASSKAANAELKSETFKSEDVEAARLNMSVPEYREYQRRLYQLQENDKAATTAAAPMLAAKNDRDRIQNEINYYSKVNYGAGNINLSATPVFDTPDGRSYITTVTYADPITGYQLLIPAMAQTGDGVWQTLTYDQAVAQYRATGKYFGAFRTTDEANTYANQLQEQQEQRFSKLSELSALYQASNDLYNNLYDSYQTNTADPLSKEYEAFAQEYDPVAYYMGKKASYDDILSVIEGLGEIIRIAPAGSDEYMSAKRKYDALNANKLEFATYAELQNIYAKKASAEDKAAIDARLAELTRWGIDPMSDREYQELLNNSSAERVAAGLELAKRDTQHVVSVLEQTGMTPTAKLVDALAYYANTGKLPDDLDATLRAATGKNKADTLGNLYTITERALKNDSRFTEQEAKNVVDYLRRQGNAMSNEVLMQKLADIATENVVTGIGMSALSVGTNLLSPLGIGEGIKTLANIGGSTIDTADPNSKWFLATNATNAIRSGIQEAVDGPKFNIGSHEIDVFDQAYGILMSGIDSMVASRLPGKLGGLVLGGSAAAQTLQEEAMRGTPIGEALLTAGAAGVFEGLLESWSIGNFKAMQEAAPITYRDVFKNVRKSFLTNMEEEAATELANVLFDVLRNSQYSNFNRDIAELMTTVNPKTGKVYTKQEAQNKVIGNLAFQVGEAGITGGLQGVLMGGVASATAINTIHQFNQLYKMNREEKGLISNLVLGSQFAQGSGTRAWSDEYLPKLQNIVNSTADNSQRKTELVSLLSELKQNSNNITDTMKKERAQYGPRGFTEPMHNAVVENVANGDDAPLHVETPTETKIREAQTAAGMSEDTIKATKHLLFQIASGNGDLDFRGVDSNTLTSMPFRGVVESVTGSKVFGKNANDVKRSLTDIAEMIGNRSVWINENDVQETQETDLVQPTDTGEADIAPAGAGANAPMRASAPGGDVMSGMVNGLLGLNNTVGATQAMPFEEETVRIPESAPAEAAQPNVGNPTVEQAQQPTETAAPAPEQAQPIPPNATVNVGGQDLTEEEFVRYALKSGEFTLEQAREAFRAAATEAPGFNDLSDKVRFAVSKVVAENEKAEAENVKSEAKNQGITETQYLTQEVMNILLSDKGLRVQYVPDSKLPGLNGEVDLKNGVIYVNSSAPDTDASSMSGLAWIIGHEIIHAAEQAQKNGQNVNIMGIETEKGVSLTDKILGYDDNGVFVPGVMQALAESGAIEGKYAEMAKDLDEMKKAIEDLKKRYTDHYVRQKKTEAWIDENVTDEFIREELAGDFFGTLLGINRYDERNEKKLGTKFKRADLLRTLAGIDDTPLRVTEMTLRERLQSQRQSKLRGQEFREAYNSTQEQLRSLWRDVTTALENAEQRKNRSAEEVEETVGVEVDEKTESANPIEMRASLASYNRSDYVQDRDAAAKDLSSRLGVSYNEAIRYIDAVNSVAKIIAEDKDRLDYESSPGRSSFVGNTEYGGSIDFSTICKKRRLYTGTIEAIQRAMPNTVLTANDVLKIRAMMKERGYEVSCGLCYVEGSRANIGEYTQQFLDELKQTGMYVPTMAEMNTAEGQEQIRAEHPEVYDAYVKFMNKLAQRKPKLFQMATEYDGEILEKFKNDTTVTEKNRNGGLRLQSFSDFEIIHLIDCMQVVMDMSRVGLAGQAYTKVPDFAKALGNTGMKINLSLIAKGVENGKIVFDDVEGMNHEEAKKLRDQYSKNVGTILVVFNDEQLMAALNDDFVDYIIPFHRSQWKKDQYEILGLPEGAHDYTDQQNESYIQRRVTKSGNTIRPKNFMPNEYWDFSKTGKENAETYLRMCAEDGRRPKFYKLLDQNRDGSYSLKADGSTDGYWKLLIDFKMYDNDGAGSPQMPVRPDFNMEESERMLREYQGGHQSFPVAHDVVDDFVKENENRQSVAGRKSVTDRLIRALDQDDANDRTLNKRNELMDLLYRFADYTGQNNLYTINDLLDYYLNNRRTGANKKDKSPEFQNLDSQIQTLIKSASDKVASQSVNDLERAVMMEAGGQNADQIFKYTGWWKDPSDEKWRFELNDKSAKFRKTADAELRRDEDYEKKRKEYNELKSKNKKEKLSPEEYERFKQLKDEVVTPRENQKKNFWRRGGKIGDVIDHKLLFDQYPGLKEVPFEFKDLGPDTGGQYIPSQNKIELNTLILGDSPQSQAYRNRYRNQIPNNGGNLSEQEVVLSVLLHEMQHQIQHQEDFTSGGSMDYTTKPAMTAAEKGRDYYANLLDSALSFVPGFTSVSQMLNRFQRGQSVDVVDDASGDVISIKPENQSAQGLEKAFEEWIDALETNGAVSPGLAARIKPTLSRYAQAAADYDYTHKLNGRSATAFNMYQALRGEQESREVQARQFMDAKERRENPFTLPTEYRTPDEMLRIKNQYRNLRPSVARNTDEAKNRVKDQDNGITVYRGSNRSENPLEKNLAGNRTVYDVLGRPTQGTELLPISYYSESRNDAENYANHDQSRFENEFLPAARREYNRLVMEGRAPVENRDDWIQQRAMDSYRLLTGNDNIPQGRVTEHQINPKSTLDLTDLGEQATVDDIYAALSKAPGLPVAEIDNQLVLGDLDTDHEYEPVDVFRLLRNEGQGKGVGSRVYEFLKNNGYDSVRYSESGTNHYAVFNDANTRQSIARGQNEQQSAEDRRAAQVQDMVRNMLARQGTPAGAGANAPTQGRDAGLGAANRGFAHGSSVDYEDWMKGAPDHHTISEEQRNANTGYRVNRDAVQYRKTQGSNHQEVTSRAAQTIRNAPVTEDGVAASIDQMVANGDFKHIRYGDKKALSHAEDLIRRNGWDGEYAKYKENVEKGITSKDVTVMGITLYNNAVTEGDTYAALDIASLMIKNASNVGSALQAQRILNSLGPDGKVYMAVRGIENIADSIRRLYPDKNIDVDKQLLTDYRDALIKDDKDAIAAAQKAIYQQVAEQLPADWKEQLNNWRYMAMLTNPSTHFRNVFGNAGFFIPRLMKQTMKAGMERVKLGKAGEGSNRTTAMLNLFSAEDRARLSAAAQDYKNVVDLIQSGGKQTGPRDEIEKYRTIFHVGDKTLKGLEWVREKNTKWLDREDTWFSLPAYAEALASYLKARGIDGADYATGNISDDVKQAAQEHAIKEAQKATYRDHNAFSDAVASLGKQGRQPNANRVQKAASIATEAVLPFKRTPANILARAWEYSPGEFLHVMFSDIGNVRRAQMATKEAETKSKGTEEDLRNINDLKEAEDLAVSDMLDHIASGATGSLLLLAGAALRHFGILNGGDDDDDEQAMFDKLQGRQNYSISIGGKNYTLDWLAPEILPVFTGVALYDALLDDKDPDGNGIIGNLTDALLGMSEPMLNMSMLSSVNDLIDTVQYLDNPTERVAAIGKNVALNYLSQYVPTIAGKMESIVSDRYRQSTYYDREGALGKNEQYFLGKLANKIPGYDYNQVDYYDAWGRQQDNGNVLKRAFANLVSPGYLRDIQTTRFDEELQDLYSYGKDTEAKLTDAERRLLGQVLPPRASQSQQVDHRYLSPEEYELYTKTQGESNYELIGDLYDSKAWNHLSQVDKARAITDLYADAKTIAANAVRSERGEPLEKTDAEKAGLKTVTYAIANTIYSGAVTPKGYNTTASGNAPTWAKMLAVINDSSLSKTDKLKFVNAKSGKNEEFETLAEAKEWYEKSKEKAKK